MDRLLSRSVKKQLLIGSGVLVLAIVIFFIKTVIFLPNPEDISTIQASQSTKIYDRAGKTLLYEIYGEKKRTIVASGEIPDFIRQATVGIEDDAFYAHPAFDWRGILRAVAVNIIRGKVVQGGSTITQQLAKNAFLSPERTITRKVKELVLAMKLEQHYSKDQILDLYLNNVPYGSAYYGVESASRAYFNKSAKEVTLSEAALLAALPRSPNYYSPWGNHQNELEERRKFVLKRMRELGYVDEQQYNAAVSDKPRIADQPENSIQAAHFSLYIQDYLREKYGEDALRTDGLKVITTIDWDMQKAAEAAIKKGVARNEALYQGGNGALVAMDPQTGQILALVGSKDYFGDSLPRGCAEGKSCRFEGKFNVAIQGLRQPGSSIKPFVYLTAFQGGFSPETILWDVPTEFSPSCPALPDYSTRDPQCYHPQNFDLQFRGPVKMKEALAQSINVPAVKTLYLAGLPAVIENASRFGLSTLNDPQRLGLSLVLGGGEVKLIELVDAYSVLAAEGVQRPPVGILKIENSKGEVLEEYKDSGKEVVAPQYPRLINDILSDVELRAPLFKNSLDLTQVPGHQVALKTGTTDHYADAWTVGYTPALVAGVWVGNNNRESLKSGGSSILAAVPIWHDFMVEALKDKPLTTFNRPSPVSSDNPVIRGELIKEDGYHNILYYLNRTSDPQFHHWEAGVKSWLGSHSVDGGKFSFSQPQRNYSFSGSGGASDDVQIKVESPQNGSFISQSMDLNFELKSANGLDKMEIYFNGSLIDNKTGDLGDSFIYRKSVSLPGNNLQNILLIKVVGKGGAQKEAQLILFR